SFGQRPRGEPFQPKHHVINLRESKSEWRDVIAAVELADEPRHARRDAEQAPADRDVVATDTGAAPGRAVDGQRNGAGAAIGHMAMLDVVGGDVNSHTLSSWCGCTWLVSTHAHRACRTTWLSVAFRALARAWSAEVNVGGSEPADICSP